MYWKYKANIMQLCASFPLGAVLYKYIQKTFGRLRAEPMSRLPALGKMAGWVLDYWNTDGEKKGIEGKRFFEVGTGHIPIAPIGWFLCGAGSIVTVDLHRRIEWGLTRQSLEWMAEHRDEVFLALSGVVNEKIFNERFSVLTKCQHAPKEFLKCAGIEYPAPMDASQTSLPDESIDCHFSITVLEHIPTDAIRDIFTEAKSILKRGGAAIHFVDLSDHFQHQDASISGINFLRFSEEEWHRIAGNEFAYCNRLRVDDYLGMFANLGYALERQEVGVDLQSKETLQRGNLTVDPIFSKYSVDNICLTSLRILLKAQK